MKKMKMLKAKTGKILAVFGIAIAMILTSIPAFSQNANAEGGVSNAPRGINQSYPGDNTSKINVIQMKAGSNDDLTQAANTGTSSYVVDYTFINKDTTQFDCSSVNTGVRFEVPYYTGDATNVITRGTVKFSGYDWLTALDNSGKAQPRVETYGNDDPSDDMLILEGYTLDSISDQVLTQATHTLIVGNTNGVNGQTIQPKVTAWIYDDDKTGTGDSLATATGDTVTITSTAEYDLKLHDAISQASGYYSPSKGKLYSTEAAAIDDGATDTIYGSTYEYVATVVMTGTEIWDYSKPISWDMDFDLLVKKNGVTTSETDSNYRPIIIGAKRNAEQPTTSELAPANDVTLGGKIDGWYKTWNNSLTANDNDTYTFTKSGDKISSSATLTDKNNTCSVCYILFAPTNDNDVDGTQRFITGTVSNLSLTSAQNKQITTDSVTTDNTIEREIPRRYLGAASELSGKIYYGGNDGVVKAGLNDYISVSGNYQMENPSAFEVSNITAINILMKVDADGVQVTSAQGNSETYLDDHNAKVTPNILFATKPDGKNWSSEDEMETTRQESLVYYDSLSDVPEGHKVVATLFEYRGGILHNNISAGISTKVIGKVGTVYETVQDISYYSGTNTTTVSYKGTNGGALPTLPAPSKIWPSNGPDANGNMVDYQKDDWSTGTAVKADGTNGSSNIGDSLMVTGYKVKVTALVQHNGTNPTSEGYWGTPIKGSTFDVGRGERTVYRSVDFDVNWLGETQDPKSKISLKYDMKNMRGSDFGIAKDGTPYMKIGNVYLGSADNPITYDANGKPSGGVLIDPNNFTVDGSGSYTIAWDESIGDELSLANDVATGQYGTHCTISIATSSSGVANFNNDWTGHCWETTIIRSATAGATKVSLNKVSATDSECGFAISSAVAQKDLNNLAVLDVLSFEGDGRGTTLSGADSYKIKDDKILVDVQSEVSGPTQSSFEVFYTTDEAIRTAGAGGAIPVNEDLKPLNKTTIVEGAVIGGATWHKATNNNDGSYSLPANTKPTAIFFIGDLKQHERMVGYIKTVRERNGFGDVYANGASISSDDLLIDVNTNNVTSTIATKKVTGTAWIDDNTDGKIDDTEQKLAGVKAVLHKVSDNSVVTSDLNGDTYGEVLTDEDGVYTFENTPDEADGYYVTFESSATTDLSKYELVTKSDFKTATTDADGKLESAKSTDVKLMSIDELVNHEIGEDVGVKNGGFVKLLEINMDDIKVHVGDDKDGSFTTTPTIINPNVTWVDPDDTTIATTAGTGYGVTVSGKKTGTTTGEVSVATDLGSSVSKEYNITVYANIIYNGNGNTGGMAPIDPTEFVNTNATAKDKGSLTKPGFTFVGWANSANATTPDYEVGDQIPMNDLTADKTVYAVWKTASTATAVPEITKVISSEDASIPNSVATPTFEFVLAAKEDYGNKVTMPANTTATATATGTATNTQTEEITATGIGDVTFNQAGTYEFYISETAGSTTGYKYDQSVYIWTVEVTNTTTGMDITSSISKKANAAAADTTATDADKVEFENTFKTVRTPYFIPAVTKSFSADSAERPSDRTFTFKMEKVSATDEVGAEISQENMPTPTKTECTITGTGSTTMANATSDGNGFGKIDNFNSVGTYVYKITETANNTEGYTYSTDEYTLTIVVTMNNEGKQLAVGTITKAGNTSNSITFENEYEVASKTFTVPTVTKKISGAVPENNDKKFEFNIKATGDNVINTPLPNQTTVSVTGEGTANFEDITFTKTGTYTYEVSEVEGNEKGYTYDDSSYEIEVVVTDNKGVLETTSTIKKDNQTATKIEFNNEYEAEEATYSAPTVSKSIEGNVPEDNDKEFKFNIEATGDNAADAPLPEDNEITITGEGTANFEDITFTEVGTYTYKVSEKAGEETGYTYDESTYEIKVVVTDNDGALEIEATITKDGEDADGIEFVNTYKANPVVVDPPVEKKISGDKPNKKEVFTFEMKAAEETNPMPEGSENGKKTVTIEGEGSAEFGEYEYTETGTYEYEISEVAGKNSEYTYDKTIYTLKDVVTDNDGNLEVTRTITDNNNEVDGAVFINKYTKPKTTITSKNGDGNVDTGDKTDINLLIIAMIMSLGVITTLSIKKRKTDK